MGAADPDTALLGVQRPRLLLGAVRIERAQLEGRVQGVALDGATVRLGDVAPEGGVDAHETHLREHHHGARHVPRVVLHEITGKMKSALFC